MRMIPAKSLAQPEGGFTMVATLIGTAVIAALALVAVTAVRGDANLTSYDLNSKRAYEAARAGVEDYSFHLYANRDYWRSCADVPSPSAVNQQGSTAKRRPVPGGSGAEYAIELLPSTSQTKYTQCSTTDPGTSMIETNGQMAGSFRIRSTGFDGKSKVSVTATFKRGSFLDYIYFTQLETSDPITYASSYWLEEAYAQCSKTVVDGRYSQPIPNSGKSPTWCNVISFVSDDYIAGPLHTNDLLAICGSPTFGRTSADSIEVSAPSPGWYPSSSPIFGGDAPGSCSGNPKFVGEFKTNQATLTPPETNSQLSETALPQFRYTGQVKICLTGTNMTVGTGSSSCPSNLYSGSTPSNGVVYVQNGACSESYSPFGTDYPSYSGCGNAYVRGTYTGPLTIAAENDIIVHGKLCRGSCSSATGSGILGLIANNFVRVYHPCSSYSEQGIDDLVVDAAILAINHSFIVDNYNCGDQLGTLNVEGAIAQKFRGPVGTFGGYGGGTGYYKNYVYDDRLQYLEPPHFIEPTGLPWVIGRETVE